MYLKKNVKTLSGCNIIGGKTMPKNSDLKDEVKELKKSNKEQNKEKQQKLKREKNEIKQKLQRTELEEDAINRFLIEIIKEHIGEFGYLLLKVYKRNKYKLEFSEIQSSKFKSQHSELNIYVSDIIKFCKKYKFKYKYFDSYYDFTNAKNMYYIGIFF